MGNLAVMFFRRFPVSFADGDLLVIRTDFRGVFVWDPQEASSATGSFASIFMPALDDLISGRAVEA